MLFSAKTKKIKHNSFSLCRRTAELGSGGAHLGVVVGQSRGGGGDAVGGRGRGRGSAQAAAPAATPRGSGDELSLPCSKRAREQASKQARKQGSQHGLGESEWGGVVLVGKWLGLDLYSHESTRLVFGLACVCT